ncbi:MAG: hypothetical protein KJZ64_12425 [Sphingomonadaceae bacterium]|nr:hypothetical protein [Sphingomonadaceae bacterium]
MGRLTAYRVLVAWVLFSATNPVFAQATLWRDLVAGEAPHIVQKKLESMPEVKRVKTKIREGAVKEQDINMNGQGIPVFEGNFSISTEYSGLSLSKVQLASGEGCANAAFAFATKISDQLAEKYPEILNELESEYEFTLKSLDATSTQSVSLSSGYSNGDTVVILTVEFFRSDPPSYVGGSDLARALYQIARSNYESKSKSCNGTGYRTSQVRLTYLSRSDFERTVEDLDAQNEVQRQRAADNL